MKHHCESTTPAALTIAQLLKFNSLAHRRAATGSLPRPVRRATMQETPVPIYVGLMLHAHAQEGANRQAGTHGDFYFL